MAAKTCKVVVNELQHGLIVNGGVVGNYPDTEEDSLIYFPDKYYIWKNLDMCTSKLPLSNKNIVEFSNAHLDSMILHYNHTQRKKKQILIISQPIHSDKILKYILKNIDELTDYSFVYKIHPAECAKTIENKMKKK